MNDTHANLIIDLGSGYSKCGFAQQLEPLILPAAFKSSKPQKSKSIFDKLDPGRRAWVFPLENGILPKDFALITKLCNLVLEQFPIMNQQREKLELTLLLFPQSPPDQITQLCKTLQNSLGCLHVEAAIQQILTWGYWGKKTALIVDIGYTTSFVTPIFRGFLLEEQIHPIITGSFLVSAEIRKLLLHQAETVPPPQASSYARLAKSSKAISKIKQSLCQIYPVGVNQANDKQVHFSFNGKELSLGAIPWQAPEVLFQPTLLGVGDKGITEVIAEVLRRVDISVRAELASNIVLAGGGAMLPGLNTRLKNDLKTLMPHLAIKVYDLEHPIYSAWLGAAKM